jgi:hypothetical protein
MTNLNDLINEAEDIFFARNSDCDEATMIEVCRDLRIFEAKIQRMVNAGDLRVGIGLKLIGMAAKVDRVPEVRCSA